ARTAREQDVELTQLAVTPGQIAELQGLVDEGKINDKIAKQVLVKVLEGQGDPAAIVEQEGLAVVSDDSVLTSALDQAIADNPDVVHKIQRRKAKAIGALSGPIRDATRRPADARKVRKMNNDKPGLSLSPTAR